MKLDNGVLIGELPEHTAEGLWVVLVENDHRPLHVPCGFLVLNPHNIPCFMEETWTFQAGLVGGRAFLVRAQA